MDTRVIEKGYVTLSGGHKNWSKIILLKAQCLNTKSPFFQSSRYWWLRTMSRTISGLST